MYQFLNNFNLNIPDWIYLSAASLTCFFLTYFAIPTIVKISHLKGLYDFPSDRKTHAKETPLLGGLAIFAGFLISCTIFCPPDGYISLLYVFGGLVALTVVGLKDDILIISPLKKLVGQFLAAVMIVVLGDIRITDFHTVFGIGHISYTSSIIFTVTLLLLFMVSFNLIDGVDGLAAGLAIIASLFYGVWFLFNDVLIYALISLSLAAALIAFFRFNVFSTENKIFLGDTGALISGLLTGVMTIEFLEFHLQDQVSLKFNSAPFISLGLFFIPIFDTIRMIIIRTPKKKFFKASKDHIHHVIAGTGLSHLNTTIILIFINLIIFVSFISLRNSGNTFLVIYSIILALLLFTAVQRLLHRYSHSVNPDRPGKD